MMTCFRTRRGEVRRRCREYGNNGRKEECKGASGNPLSPIDSSTYGAPVAINAYAAEPPGESS
mgnify:CR=1 FL=1